MKSLLVLALSLAITLSASAGCETSTLQVHTALHRPIKVYVDGSTGSNPPTVGVIVEHVTPGPHRLKVVEIYTDADGYRVRRTVYTGTITVHPSVYMDARVDEGRGVAIHDTHVPCGDQYNATQGDNSQDDQHSDQRYANNNDQQANTGTAAPSTPAPTTHLESDALPPHMSDADFTAFLGVVATPQYETKRMDTLKATIGTSQFSANQVSQVMGLFSFESNKLDVAKLMYDHTVDKQDYAALALNFNFDARKEEFQKFLKSK
jgi:hypothetical protein